MIVPVLSSVSTPEMPPFFVFCELFRADDVVVEGRAAGVEQVDAFERVGEVARHHRFAVRVLEPLAQLQRVGLAVVGDFRHPGGEAGDHLAARGAVGVGVGEQRDVGVVHRRPAFAGVGQGRVEVVGEGRVGAQQGAAFVAGAAAGARTAGRGAAPAAGGERQRRERSRHNTKDCLSDRHAVAPSAGGAETFSSGRAEAARRSGAERAASAWPSRSAISPRIRRTSSTVASRSPSRSSVSVCRPRTLTQSVPSTYSKANPFGACSIRKTMKAGEKSSWNQTSSRPGEA